MMLTKVSKTEEDSIIKEARLLYQDCAPGRHVAKIFERFVLLSSCLLESFIRTVFAQDGVGSGENLPELTRM